MHSFGLFHLAVSTSLLPNGWWEEWVLLFGNVNWFMGSVLSSFFLVQHFLATSCSQFLLLFFSCSIRSCAFCARLLGPFFRQHLSMLQELGLSPLAIALWVWYCWWTLTEWFCFKGSKHPTGWWQGWIWLRWYLREAEEIFEGGRLGIFLT